MVPGILEAVKRLSKAEFSKDIKGGKVEPGPDIKLGPLFAVLDLARLVVHPLDKKIDVFLNQRLLCLQRTSGEPGSQYLSNPSMAFRPNRAEYGVRLALLPRPPDGVLEELFMALTDPEDVVVRISMRKGDLIRRSPHNRPVFLV